VTKLPYTGPERRKFVRPSPIIDPSERVGYREGWMIALSIIAVVALFGAVLSFIRDSEQDSQREKDRISFDLASCERANDNREHQRDVAEAGANLDREIIELLTQVRDEAYRKAIFDLLAPAFAHYQEAIDKIENIDCPKVVRESISEAKAVGDF
jgi:hypothetical protein